MLAVTNIDDIVILAVHVGQSTGHRGGGGTPSRCRKPTDAAQ
jgi:hypothetical protein